MSCHKVVIVVINGRAHKCYIYFHCYIQHILSIALVLINKMISPTYFFYSLTVTYIFTVPYFYYIRINSFTINSSVLICSVLHSIRMAKIGFQSLFSKSIVNSLFGWKLLEIDKKLSIASVSMIEIVSSVYLFYSLTLSSSKEILVFQIQLRRCLLK